MRRYAHGRKTQQSRKLVVPVPRPGSCWASCIRCVQSAIAVSVARLAVVGGGLEFLGSAHEGEAVRCVENPLEERAQRANVRGGDANSGLDNGPFY